MAQWLQRFRASLPPETTVMQALDRLGLDTRPLRDRPLPDAMLWNVAGNRLLRVALGERAREPAAFSLLIATTLEGRLFLWRFFLAASVPAGEGGRR